ncbi:hypothetical protein LCGC14_2651340, partial [marine sediment metagenome]
MNVDEIRSRLYTAIDSVDSEQSLEMMGELGSLIPAWLRHHLEQEHSTPSPSTLMDCRFCQWLRARKEPPDQDIPTYWKIRRVAGVLQEPYWLHIFKLAGFDVVLPDETYACGPLMQAHPDALVNDFVLELKSVQGWGFKNLMEGYGVATESPGHYTQANLYLYAAKKKKCLYVATPPDPGLLQSILRQKKRYGSNFNLDPLYLEFIERDEATIEAGLRRAE